MRRISKNAIDARADASRLRQRLRARCDGGCVRRQPEPEWLDGRHRRRDRVRLLLRLPSLGPDAARSRRLRRGALAVASRRRLAPHLVALLLSPLVAALPAWAFTRDGPSVLLVASAVCIPVLAGFLVER